MIVVRCKGGKGGRIVIGGMRWQFGKVAVVVRWQFGKARSAVRWQGRKDGRVVRCQGGRSLLLFKGGERRGETNISSFCF